MRIGRSCQPLGSDAREFQCERAAPARMQGLPRGLAQNCPDKTVGHDQPEVIREQGLRKIRRHGEIKQIAEGEMIRPFAVAGEIGRRHFDLDARDGAVSGKRGYV